MAFLMMIYILPVVKGMSGILPAENGNKFMFRQMFILKEYAVVVMVLCI